MTTPAPPKAEQTVSEASAAHNIPIRSLHQAVARGTIPARKIGPMWLVDAEAARLYGEIFRAREALDAYTGRATENDSE